MMTSKPAPRHSGRAGSLGGAAILCAVLTISGAQPAAAIELLRLGQGKATAESWLVSDWPAGQSRVTHWSADNVAAMVGGGVKIILDSDPDDDAIYRGGEVQSSAVADEGEWVFRTQAPEMVSGAVFGMFLYQASWKNDPWREYDIEFVGGDTTEVQLNIHFEDADGRRVSLGQARGGPVTVDLGFDAAKGMHDYAIEVSPRKVEFRVDGKVLGRFGAQDMPGNVWSDGSLRGFVDLWAAAPGQADWTGTWTYPGQPLVALIERLTVPGGATLSQ